MLFSKLLYMCQDINKKHNVKILVFQELFVNFSSIFKFKKTGFRGENPITRDFIIVLIVGLSTFVLVFCF